MNEYECELEASTVPVVYQYRIGLDWIGLDCIALLLKKDCDDTEFGTFENVWIF